MKALKLLSFVLLIILLLAIKYVKENERIKQKLIELEIENKLLTDSLYQLTKLTDDNILFWCKYFDIKFPQVILAQMRLETGHFTSDLCLQANNLVGMKHPKTRQTTASYTTSSGYGGYASYIEHIYDIKLWQDYYCVDTIKDDLSYIDFLCRFHATDKQYKQKLLKLMR